MEPTNNPGLQRRIRDALYQLKLDWGVLVDVYKLVSSETDYDTGEKQDVIAKTTVRRAVKMPAETARASYISPYFTQTNKPFITKGAGWDEVTDVFVFDGRDLRNYEFEIQDWITWNHQRYEIKSFEEIGQGAGWVVLTTWAKGSPPYESYPVSVDHAMELVDFTVIVYLAEALSNLSLSSAVAEELIYGRSETSTMSLVSEGTNEILAGDFVSSWDTRNTSAGSSASDQIALPLVSTGSYNFTVDWGDGDTDVITTWNQLEKTHTYTIPGIYEVRISGTCTGFSFNNTLDKLKILEISSWGDINLGTSIGGFFYGCTNLTFNVVDNTLNMSGCTRFDNAFLGCTSMTQMPLIDTSAVINFTACWSGCTGMTSFPLLDFSSATTMANCWTSCSSLTSFPAIVFPVAVASFSQVWKGCSGLTSFPAIDFSNATNMFEAWRNCTSLTSFPAIDFTSALALNTTWFGCTSMTSFGACTFPVATSMTLAWYGCNQLKTFPGISFPSIVDLTSAWRLMGTGVTFQSGFDISNVTTLTTAWTETQPLLCERL